MSIFNKLLLEEINLLRTNPQEYAQKLLKYSEYFKAKILYIPGSNAGIQTDEGPQAYKEAAESLLKEESREALFPSKGLSKISEEIVCKAQEDADTVESIKVDKLIEKIGSVKGSLSRLIEFGGLTPEQVVINLVVCDGDPSRGQRKSLLNPYVKLIGLANGKHELYGHCTSIITATEFKNNVDSNDIGFAYGQKFNIAGDVNNNDDDDDMEEGVLSTEKSATIVSENGKKKKITKVIKYMKDGTKRIETSKEDVP